MVSNRQDLKFATFSAFLFLFLFASSGHAEPDVIKVYATIAEKEIGEASFSTDGKTLVIGSSTNRLTLWDVATKKVGTSFEKEDSPYQNCIFASNSKSLFYDFGRKVMHLNLDNAKQSELFQLEGEFHFADFLHLSKDGKLLAAGGGPEMKVWDLAAGKQLKAFETKGYLRDLRLFPDGKTLAGSVGIARTPGVDGVWLWDLTGKDKPRHLRHEKYNGSRMAISPDGKTIVLVADATTDTVESELLVWDVTKGEVRAKWNVNIGIESLLFSPDGRILITAGGRPDEPFGRVIGRIILLDTATGKTLHEFVASPAALGRIALSPDGKLLATANYSPRNEMKVFDISAVTVPRK